MTPLCCMFFSCRKVNNHFYCTGLTPQTIHYAFEKRFSFLWSVFVFSAVTLLCKFHTVALLAIGEAPLMQSPKTSLQQGASSTIAPPFFTDVPSHHQIAPGHDGVRSWHLVLLEIDCFPRVRMNIPFHSGMDMLCITFSETVYLHNHTSVPHCLAFPPMHALTIIKALLF